MDNSKNIWKHLALNLMRTHPEIASLVRALVARGERPHQIGSIALKAGADPVLTFAIMALAKSEQGGRISYRATE